MTNVSEALTLTMRAVSSSAMLDIFYQTTAHNISKDSHLEIELCPRKQKENLRSLQH
jgi:hypothetical protein